MGVVLDVALVSLIAPRAVLGSKPLAVKGGGEDQETPGARAMGQHASSFLTTLRWRPGHQHDVMLLTTVTGQALSVSMVLRARKVSRTA